MTALEYNILDFNHKLKLVKEFGLLIDEKRKGDERIRVYSMGDFFVEECLRFDNNPQFVRAMESLLDSEYYMDPLHVFYLN